MRRRAEMVRTAILAGPRRVELEEVSRVEPGPGQVRVRLAGCGLCGSNLPAWPGREWFRYRVPPGSPGHEGWGEIAAVGAGVRRLFEGDRVALLSTGSFAEEEVALAELVVPLAELGRAFEALEERREGFLKAVVVP